MRLELDQLPVNGALLSLVGNNSNNNGLTTDRDDANDLLQNTPPPAVPQPQAHHYFKAIKCIKDLALFLKPFSGKF